MARLAREAALPATPSASRASRLGLAPRSARAGVIVGIYVAVALLSGVYVSQTSLAASSGYGIGTLESGREQWCLRNDQLQLQIAEASSLATIEREASRLGMEPPERSVRLRLVQPPSGGVASPNAESIESKPPDTLAGWIGQPW